MNVLSLFDGISCGRVALERANIKVDTYIASEIDPFAIQVAQKNYPTTIQVGDIRNLRYKNDVLYADNKQVFAGKIDMIIGGSPCQSFTFAGKQQGMTTSTNEYIVYLDDYIKYKEQGYTFEGQSYLYWEYVRLLEEINPEYFLLENVIMQRQWKDVITSTLGVNFLRINSNLLSAQNRDRLYWSNIKDNRIKQPADKGLVIADIIDENSDILKYQLTKQHLEGFLKSYSWKPCDLNDKASPLLATYYKQPPHAPYIASKVSESGFRRLSPLECERLQTLPDDYTEGISESQRYKCIGNGWTVDVIAYIFSHIN